MLGSEQHQRVRASHLKRDAYLYVRQSTLRQVFENTESTKRQYALRDRAVALGWPLERIVIIDSDQGQSGAAADRQGFQKLVAEVGLGHAGIVLGLEVSRLARNSVEWSRLLEICALTDTLILDEDGIYDPGHFNDRLLLGLKGTMSEAELHILRARLRGGILSKASRGELKDSLPVGFVYGPDNRVILDPDQQVQQAINTFFQTFGRTGSAFWTVRVFHEQTLLFPRRLRGCPHTGEMVWAPLTHSTALRILHNPRYAGAFFFGRCQTRRTADGRKSVQRLPRDQWHFLIPNAHPGYITWDEYEANRQRLLENAHAYGIDRRQSPPREGPALLQGLAICGICGNRMTVRYHTRERRLLPDYVCQREGIERAKQPCQTIKGTHLDQAIGELLVEAVTPMALEVALAVQQELADRAQEVDRLRRQQVERARYEADLAQRRYMRVDPDNRLVTDTLESLWNQKLRELTEAQEEYERQGESDSFLLNEQQRAEILALATDFPRLWQDPHTPDRERKRMVRLILEDVTLIKGTQITAHVRFKGGATRSLTLPIPPLAWQLYQTDPLVIKEIDRLLDQHTDGEVAVILNERGLCSGRGRPFTRMIVTRIRSSYGLADRYSRLRDSGMLTMQEMAQRLGVCNDMVKIWRRRGLLRAKAYNDKGQYLFEPPGEGAPVRGRWKVNHQIFSKTLSKQA
jgi:DNA invertase Pin-like site-specific DNA recombinase